jgi:cytochrome b pre-mRNA-processing protein 3
MFKRLLSRRDTRLETASQRLYAEIVAQTRRPEFYTSLEVEDTLDGRFDILVLHAVLLFRRLKAEGEEARALSQAVFDTMFVDLDQNVRELGASDVTVGRKVKTMASAFYGRAAAYDRALDRFAADPGELEDVLRRNVYAGTAAGNAPVRALAAYMQASAGLLAGTPVGALLAGDLRYAIPSAPDGTGMAP